MNKLVFILIVIVLMITGCTGDVLQASYVDYAAVEVAGSVARGWIPSFFPGTAVQIEEAHDLDTNQSCLFAHLPNMDEQSIAASLSGEGFSRYEGELPPPPQLSSLRVCPFSLADVPAKVVSFNRELFLLS